MDVNKWPYFTGAFGTHFYIHPNQFFYKVPDDLEDKIVVGANCAISQSFAGLIRIGVKLGETILIQGAGGLGLYASCIAKEMGANVIVCDSVQDRLSLAKRFGADHIIDISKYPSIEEREKITLKLTNNTGVDCAMEVTGYPPAFEEGLRHLKVGGRYALMGLNVIGKEVSMSPGYITRKAISVSGLVRYSPNYLKKSLSFLQKFQNKYPFNELSDQIYPMDDIQNVMEMVYDHKIIRAALKP